MISSKLKWYSCKTVSCLFEYLLKQAAISPIANPAFNRNNLAKLDLTESSMNPSDTGRLFQQTSSLVEECDRIKFLLHTHSFTYDYHLVKKTWCYFLLELFTLGLFSWHHSNFFRGLAHSSFFPIRVNWFFYFMNKWSVHWNSWSTCGAPQSFWDDFACWTLRNGLLTQLLFSSAIGSFYISTRWVWSTLLSHCALDSKQCCRQILATCRIIFGGHRESDPKLQSEKRKCNLWAIPLPPSLDWSFS